MDIRKGDFGPCGPRLNEREIAAVWECWNVRFCEKLKNNPLIVSREANVFSILFSGVFPCQCADTSRWQAAGSALLCKYAWNRLCSGPLSCTCAKCGWIGHNVTQAQAGLRSHVVQLQGKNRTQKKNKNATTFQRWCLFIQGLKTAKQPRVILHNIAEIEK